MYAINVHFKIHVAISVKYFITGFIVFRPEFIMQFTAMTAHLEIDYLLNRGLRVHGKLSQNGAPINKRIILPF